jgi:cell division protease FtsH
MMCSRQLDAYTLRLSSPHTDDSDLEAVFARAADRCPSVILFEDLDRAFPRKGESHSKVTLQSLLNCLDGAATQDGTIVIATANEPTALDPAILRRPGRFDRVVHFANPHADLRRACFRKLNPALAEDDLAPAVTASEGFSFAQLRETYILAGQRSFERGDEITALDLFAGVQALKQGWAKASERIERRGFVPELARV